MKKKSKRVSASEKEYNQLAKKAEAKLKRINKNYGVDLTKEIKIPDFSTMTTKQRNEQKDKLRSFTNKYNQKYQFKKNQHGVVYTQSELTKAELMQGRADRLTNERNKKTAHLPHFNTRGEQQGFVSDTLFKFSSKGDYAQLGKFDINKMRSRTQLDMRLETLKNRSSIEHYRKTDESLKEAFIDIAGRAFSGIDEGQELIKELEKLNPTDFYEFYRMFDNLNINNYASKTGEYYGEDPLMEHINKLMSDVRRYKRFQGVA